MQCPKQNQFLDIIWAISFYLHKKFVHHMLLFFICSKIKKNCYQNFSQCIRTMPEQGFQDVVNINKKKFQPYDDLVDQSFSQFIEHLFNSH